MLFTIGGSGRFFTPVSQSFCSRGGGWHVWREGGGTCVAEGVWQWSMHGGGMYGGRGMHEGGVHGGGMHADGGKAWWGSMCGGGVMREGEMATEAGGTHLT